jgi:signal transduction histidine kinase
MEALEAIEFIVRGARSPMRADEVFENARHLVMSHDPLTREEMDQIILDHPRHFRMDQQGVITIHPDRRQADKQVFQERIARLRGMLRVFPFTDHAELFEVVLIYALAVRKPGQHAALMQPSISGLDPIIAELIKEFPHQMRGISMLMESTGASLGLPLTSQLIHLTHIRLEPWEYVQIMRNALASPAAGQYATPWSIGVLMGSLLGDEVLEVFDPAADSGVLPIVVAADRDRSISCTAVFFNARARLLSILQARVLGMPFKTFSGSVMADYELLPEQVDHCISIPPFGGKARERMGFARDGQPLYSVESYELAINQMIKRLSPGGRAIVLVPESMLFSTARTSLRKHIMEQGMLKAIISLPSGLFPNTGVKTSILILQKTSSAADKVRFVDASLHCSSTVKQQRMLDVDAVLNAYQSTYSAPGVIDVDITEIGSDEQVSWTMSRFTSRINLAQIVAESPGMEVVELGNVLREDHPALAALEGLPMFQVSELSTDVLDLVRSANDGKRDGSYSQKGARRLDTSALLMARVGGILKPTIFEPENGPIAVGSNVFMFRVDTSRADAEYLAIELRSPMVQDQLDAYHQGSTIASIAKADLLQIRVRLPDLPQQLRIVRERKEAILLAKKEEIARQEKQHGLSSDEWRILGAVEHSFRPVLSLVEQPMEAIRLLAANLDAQKQAEVSAELTKIDSGLDRMRGLFKLINSVIRSDKDSLRPVPVDLRRLFRTEVRGLAQELKDLRVYFQCEAGLETPDGVIAKVDPRQFALVVQNLLTNMAKHARRPERDDLNVLVHVSTRTEPGRTWLVITVENDGKPFPEGFSHNDLITFGQRLDATNGNGIGGFLMDRIIANHNGRFLSFNLELDERSARDGFREEQRLDENHWVPYDWELGSTHMTVRFTIELPIDNTAPND